MARSRSRTQHLIPPQRLMMRTDSQEQHVTLLDQYLRFIHCPKSCRMRISATEQAFVVDGIKGNFRQGTLQYAVATTAPPHCSKTVSVKLDAISRDSVILAWVPSGTSSFTKRLRLAASEDDHAIHLSLRLLFRVSIFSVSHTITVYVSAHTTIQPHAIWALLQCFGNVCTNFDPPFSYRPSTLTEQTSGENNGWLLYFPFLIYRRQGV